MTPTAQVLDSRVAIVARDQRCNDTAEALLSRFRSSSDWEIDPHSETQLQLVECSARLASLPSEPNPTPRSRSRRFHRGYAVLIVQRPGQSTAQLLGVGTSTRHVTLTPSKDLVQPSKAVAEESAADLFRQLDPQDLIVTRHAYPRAPEGTLRHRLHEAVLAEQDGDLPRALELLLLASEEHPSRLATRYLEDLERRLHVPAPPSVP